MKKYLIAAVLSCGLPVVSIGAETASTPVATDGGQAKLSPANTKLQFVCAHRGPKPDPRKGTFTKFSGTAEVDASSKTLKSVALEIDTNSISTEFGKLTSHLKGPDFFDTRQHPTASFKSKKVTPGSKAGEYTVVGDLTLHGVTKEVKAPVTVVFGAEGMSLTSQFAIDRSQFGMNFGADKIENTVQLTVAVGEANPKLAEGGN
jgi:polyisoprenoid-binding protein YceI